MRTIRVVSAFVLLPSIVIACSSSPRDEAEATMSTAQAVTTTGLAVASISFPGGHRVDFFAPPDGTAAIGEVGPTGTPRVLDDNTLATKKPSEIYTMLSGGAPPPAALVIAENRTSPTAASSSPPPASEPGHGSGPQFYTQSDQTWFYDTYCETPYTECVQGYSWAYSSYGHNSGRGYYTVGMVGSEATVGKDLVAGYWTGSYWATLAAEAISIGGTAWITGGNTGSCNGDTNNWYFESSVINGDEGNPTVSLMDHVYSTCGGQQECCDGVGCLSGCAYGPPGDCQGRTYYVETNDYCPVCGNDSCCNPP